MNAVEAQITSTAMKPATNKDRGNPAGAATKSMPAVAISINIGGPTIGVISRPWSFS